MRFFKLIAHSVLHVLRHPRQFIALLPYGLKLLRNPRLLPGYWRLFIYKLRARSLEFSVWQKQWDQLSPFDCQQIKAHIKTFHYQPLISIITPTYNTPAQVLREMLNSVRAQLYEKWELCIADDASSDPTVRAIIEKCANLDSRIKYQFRTENGHISEASNTALALATGDYIALLDHDDLLSPHALYMVINELNNHPDAEFIYSDEDKIDQKGRRYDPFFKPDWNPTFFLTANYLCHFSVIKAELVRQAGGFQIGYEGSQDHDLFFRVIEKIPGSHIRHIPYILYHWRSLPTSTASGMAAKNYAYDARIKAMQAHFARTRVNATIIPSNDYEAPRVLLPIPEPEPLISIIIPTRDQVNLLRQCITSIIQLTDYKNYEIIVVDNGSSKAETLHYFNELKIYPNIRMLTLDVPFNFSYLNNTAVKTSQSDYICFLNNDTEVISPHWLTEMLSYLVQPDVGAVGAKLYYPNDTVQHAGVILGMGGIAGHLYKYASRRARGFLLHARDFSAVTAACMLVKRKLFNSLGGFDEALAVAHNDIDLCIRMIKAGYRIVWTPHAELYHYESRSRGYKVKPKQAARSEQEKAYIKDKHDDIIMNDPQFNPNLSLDTENIRLATQPRLKKPWLN